GVQWPPVAPVAAEGGNAIANPRLAAVVSPFSGEPRGPARVFPAGRSRPSEQRASSNRSGADCRVEHRLKGPTTRGIPRRSAEDFPSRERRKRPSPESAIHVAL